MSEVEPDAGGPGEDAEAGLTPGRFARRGLWLLASGVALYLVAPSLVEVFSSWDDVTRVQPWAILLVLALQLASMWCLWSLLRLALDVDKWFPVVTSQLAGNAASRVVPGGAAAGAAIQFRMLRAAGVRTGNAATALTAVGLLQLATTLSLPLAALPAIIGGVSAPRALVHAAWLGAAVFVVVFAFATALAVWDSPLRAVGRLVERLLHLRPGGPPPGAVAARLVHERNLMRAALGRHWKLAAAFAVGRTAFDYLSLLAALAAVDATPAPALVLLAYAAAALLGTIPITPGGLGFVEAGLTGTLTLAGVSGAAAVAAVLLYRLVSFWLPVPVGLGAAGLFAVRNRRDDRSQPVT